MKVKLLSITKNAEDVIEQAARTCYLSYDKATDNSKEKMIKMLINSDHTSVLEHSYATFRVDGASRSFTHQIVRHRLASFSQQSQRYVDESNFHYVIPPSIQENPDALKLFESTMKTIEESYIKLREMNIKKEDARFLLPNAIESIIVISANFREWRHIFELRCSMHAQWEIRQVALEMLKILKEKAPHTFGDFELDEKTQTAVIKK